MIGNSLHLTASDLSDVISGFDLATDVADEISASLFRV
jgi:hypothetical protein